MNKIIIFLFAAALSLSACNNSNKTETNSAEVKSDSTQTATIYQCPMKCEGEKTYDKAGTCPVCGMDLANKED